jgi:hypothetical protein
VIPLPIKSSEAARSLVLGLVFLQAGDALGRMSHRDAEEVDREEALNTETWNDALSYRHPLSWERDFSRTNIGLRVTAGSLNMTRLFYDEEIILRSSDQNRAMFSFKQNRQENMLEETQSQEFRVAWLPIGHLQTSILAEGGAKKEFGDLGVGVGWFESWQRNFEIRWWSVDHFYNEKKADPNDSMKPIPWTLAAHLVWDEGAWLRTRLDWESDGRSKWFRPSKGWNWTMKRDRLRWNVATGPAPSWELRVRGDLESKFEEKYWFNADDTTYEKSFNRDASEFEISGSMMISSAEYAAGLLRLDRKVDASWRDDPLIPPGTHQENESPDTQRAETALWLTRNAPLSGSSGQSVQLGAFWNNVMIEESANFSANEVKFQTAWAYDFDKNVRAFVNATWDLDQLTHDFPWVGQQFRPWGGGNVQFMASF